MADFPEGSITEREAADTKVLIAHGEDGLCAVRNRCPHLGLSLTSGPGGKHYEDGVIRCPWHNSTFVVCTGENLDWTSGIAGRSIPRWSQRLLAAGRSPASLTTYPVQVDGEDVYVEV